MSRKYTPHPDRILIRRTEFLAASEIDRAETFEGVVVDFGVASELGLHPLLVAGCAVIVARSALLIDAGESLYAALDSDVVAFVEEPAATQPQTTVFESSCQGCGAPASYADLDVTMRCAKCRALRGLPPLATKG